MIKPYFYFIKFLYIIKFEFWPYSPMTKCLIHQIVIWWKIYLTKFFNFAELLFKLTSNWSNSNFSKFEIWRNNIWPTLFNSHNWYLTINIFYQIWILTEFTYDKHFNTPNCYVTTNLFNKKFALNEQLFNLTSIFSNFYVITKFEFWLNSRMTESWSKYNL